jgi:D-sedoheptulose 7-phosphate isomerase
MDQERYTIECLGARMRLAEKMLQAHQLQDGIVRVAQAVTAALSSGRKLLIFGNGGSAAEAQHFAAELVCQFGRRRRALPAMALTTDSSILTAQANDYSYESVFQRQIEAFAQPGDVVIGMTTSDAKLDDSHSRNIFNAFAAARAQGALTVGLFSQKTVDLVQMVDIALQIPETDTALIQEGHLAVIHILSGLIEADVE